MTDKNNLIYGIHDAPATWKEWLLYSTQQLLAVFVATVLIATICGTSIDACLFSGGIGTILYCIITKFSSPMYISSCGGTVSAVIAALAIGNCGQNYAAIAIGGLIMFAVYAIVAYAIKLKGIEYINSWFPPSLIGAITMVIGINLAGFIGTYVQVGGTTSNWGVLIALFTMGIIAYISHYCKGFMKTIPFLIGLVGGYIVSLILTICKVAPIIDFSVFSGVKFFSIPHFVFLEWNKSVLSFTDVLKIAVIFLPVSCAIVLEHFSDHRVLSAIIGTDLTETPGLHRTLLGDGAASALGTILSGLPNTSYGESIATTGFSRVASVRVILGAAAMMIMLSFIGPVQAFIQSIPSCVFGGCAMILYGYIFASGLKTIVNNKVDLENNKNLIIISVVLTIGVSGIFIFNSAFTGVSFSMIVGLILNKSLK